MKKVFVLLLSAALLLSGCSQPPASESVVAEVTAPTEASVLSADFSREDGDMFTNRDRSGEYDEASAVHIALGGSSTVEITEEGTYILSGTLENGMVVVNAPDTAKVQLVLNGAHISSETCAALYILRADKVFVTLAEGTENSLANGGSFTPIDGNNIDAALFSKEDLTINGSGSLTVTSPAGHGVVSKDDLVITGGNLQVDAASHALDANNSIRFTGASLQATAGKDGIHCENKEDSSLGFVYISGGKLSIRSEGDGISAGSNLHITAGSFDITADGGSENGTKASSDNWGGFMGGRGGPGGGRPGQQPGGAPGAPSGDAEQTDSTSMKGIKSGSDLWISGGSFVINAADDALHSNASLTVSGGSFDIATGDDGFHAEDTLTVQDGTIRISESYEGLEALHVVVSGGDIRLTARDDGLNAAGGTDMSGMTGGRDGMFGRGPGGMSANSDGTILISGGTLYVNASGDGLDANGTLEITGGHTTVAGPAQGDTATLDYDISGTITGGTFLGTGASGMAQTFSSSEQGVISVSAGSQAAGTRITLADREGRILLSFEPELSFQVVILSSPDIISGEVYTLTIGTQSGEVTAA